MAEQDRGSDDPRLAAIARHALHDEELIAAYAAGDVDDPAEADRARALFDRCPTCHELHDDLAAIRSAAQASGTAAERAATQRAPRDFRLTTDDAVRLRPGVPIARPSLRVAWATRVLHGVASFGRPLGTAFAAFGVVGLLLGSLTLVGTPFAAMRGAAAPTTAPHVDGTGGRPAASDEGTTLGPAATGRNGGGETTGGGGGSGGGASSGSALLLGGSAALIVVGLFLVVAARRGAPSISAGRGN